MIVRPPAVAGRFYPSGPEALRRAVGELLDAAAAPKLVGRVEALIAPHAGYRYSGGVAASAFATLRSRRDAIRRVVLLGTAHSPVLGLATTRADAFETPMGTVAVDREAVEEALGSPVVTVDEGAHRVDHALEVELPFLQATLDRFAIAPFLVGRCDPEEVAGVIDRLWTGDDTVVVVSTDLSHYHPAVEASRLDRATAGAIEALDSGRLVEGTACGRRAVAGLLIAARRRGLRCVTLDLRHSGDAGGPDDRVVGYGAFAFLRPEAERGAA